MNLKMGSRATTVVVIGSGLVIILALIVFAPYWDYMLGGTGQVCVINRDTLFQKAQVSQNANAQLRQILANTQASFQPEQASLQADINSFNNSKASMAATDAANAQRDLNARVAAFQQKSNAAGQQIEAMRNDATQKVGNAAAPIVTDIEHRSGCGVLLNQSAMIDAGKAHDITPAVLAAMDAKLAPIQVGVPQTTQP